MSWDGSNEVRRHNFTDETNVYFIWWTLASMTLTGIQGNLKWRPV